MSGELTVQCAKLHEWLLARRAIPENYAHLLLGVEAKVNDALMEPVVDECAKALIAQHRDSMTYFATRDIYDAVAKSPEGQAKSFLGTHTHPGPAKWKAAMDAYRRKNLRWASAARLLIQNVNYEIPALKKHAAACERQCGDCSQRQQELVRAEANAKARYQDLLRVFSIDGFDPRRELRAHAAAGLPRLHEEVAKLLQASGEDLAKYYQAFAEHVTGGGGPLEELLPMLRAFTQKGNVPVEDIERMVPALGLLRQEDAATGQRRKTDLLESTASAGQAASSLDAGLLSTDDVDRDALRAVGGDDGGVDGGIDWGGGIKWEFEVTEEGGSTTAMGQSGGGIDGDGGLDNGVSTTAALPAEVIVDGGGIDWGSISFEGVELGGVVAECGEGRETNSDVGSAASHTVLDDPHARELLFQDIAEVGAFLQTRCVEMDSSTSCDDQGPLDAQKSMEEMRALMDVTNMAEELLTGKATQRLLLLRSSDHYLEQNVRRVELARAQCSKPVMKRAELEKLKNEQADEARRSYKQLEELCAATRRYQEELEAELCAHFRTHVRITGTESAHTHG